ncbi:MAG: hypothetical protein GY725_05260 [bacterium]|nr:hypothetical protein [bacterium]
MGYFPGTGDHDPDAPGGEFFPPADPNGTVRWNFNPPGGISAGQSSSEMYVTSVCAPGTGQDTIVSLGGEFGFDASSDCLGPMVQPSCDLDIEKFCFVEPPAPSTGDDCQCKVIETVFEYTGDACSATTNYQEGKFECSGDPGFATPVEITESISSIDVAPTGQVTEILDRVTLRATSGNFPSNTGVSVKQARSSVQDLVIHASCSKALNVGDQFGSLKLVKLETTNGGVVELQDPNASAETNSCSVPVAPIGTPCSSRPSAVSIRYVGGGCADTTNDQSGAYTCVGDAGTAEPVRIIVSEGGSTYLDTGLPATQELGDISDALASAAGESKFPTNTDIRIYNSVGTEIEMLRIHTSCSKSLAIGDRFGAIQIVGFDDVNFGDTVEYTYNVTNPNGEDVVNVAVTDDKISNVICPSTTIPAAATMTCTADQFISLDTLNTATVTGQSVSGAICDPGFAGANVTIDEVDVSTTKKKKKKKSKKKVRKKVDKKKRRHRH